MGVLGVQHQVCRPCGAKRAFQLGVQAGRLAQLGKEGLLRRVNVAG